MLKSYFKLLVLSFSPTTAFCRCFPGTLLLSSQCPCNCRCTLHSLTKHKFLKGKDCFLLRHIPRAYPNTWHGGDTLYILMLTKGMTEWMHRWMHGQTALQRRLRLKEFKRLPHRSLMLASDRTRGFHAARVGRRQNCRELGMSLQNPVFLPFPKHLPEDGGPCVISASLGLNFDMQTRSTFLNAFRTGEHLAILVSITTTSQTTAPFVGQALW